MSIDDMFSEEERRMNFADKKNVITMEMVQKAVDVAYRRGLQVSDYAVTPQRYNSAIQYFKLGMAREAHLVLAGAPIDEDGILTQLEERDE